MQTLPLGVAALVESGRFSVRKMIRFDLPGGSTGIWSGEYNLTYAGVVYAACAGALACSPVPGATGLGTDSMDVTVSGLNPAALDLVANTPWHQQPAVVSDAFLDEAGAVQFVHPVFSGFLDTVDTASQDQGTTTLAIHVESNSRELGRAVGRIRSDSDQRTVDSADGFYRYVGAVAANTPIYWGRKGPHSPFG